MILSCFDNKGSFSLCYRIEFSQLRLAQIYVIFEFSYMWSSKATCIRQHISDAVLGELIVDVIIL